MECSCEVGRDNDPRCAERGMCGKEMTQKVHNVDDRRRSWIGSWEVEPLDYAALGPEHIGRTVIYQPGGRWQKMMPTEAGTLTSWRDGLVFARYSRGDTAAASTPDKLVFGVRPLDGPAL